MKSTPIIRSVALLEVGADFFINNRQEFLENIKRYIQFIFNSPQNQNPKAASAYLHDFHANCIDQGRKRKNMGNNDFSRG